MNIQKVLGRTVGIAGLATAAMTTTYYLSAGTMERFLEPTILLVVPVSIGFLISARCAGWFWRFYQALLISVFGCIAMVSNPDAFWGHGLLYLGFLVTNLYELGSKRLVLVLFGFAVFFSVELGVFLPGYHSAYFGINILIFDALFFAGVEIILKKRIATHTLRLGKQIKRLTDQLGEYRRSAIIEQLVDRLGILPAELRVMTALYDSRGSNKEIAQSLGLAVSTVKLQLYNIYNKVGVDSRTELIGFIDRQLEAAA